MADLPKIRIPLSPIEIGKTVMEGLEEKEFYFDPPIRMDTWIGSTVGVHYVRLLTNPVYRNERWEAVAVVNESLCMVEVSPYKEI